MGTKEEGGGGGREVSGVTIPFVASFFFFYQAADTQAEWQGPGIEGLPSPITNSTATPGEVKGWRR